MKFMFQVAGGLEYANLIYADFPTKLQPDRWKLDQMKKVVVFTVSVRFCWGNFLLDGFV